MNLVNKISDLIQLAPSIDALISNGSILGRSGRMHQVQGTSTIREHLTRPDFSR